MSKYNKIQWRESDKKELARLTKNFNAKLEYQLKKNPELKDVLPEKVKVRDLKKDIVSRKDLKRTLDKLATFSQRGMEKVVTNEKGERATLFEIEQAKKNVRRLNAQRRAEQKKIDEMPVYIDGKKAVTVRRMVQEQKAKPIQFDFNKSEKGGFKKFADYVEKKISDSRYEIESNAYLATLKETFYSVYDTATAQKLGELCDKVGGEKLISLYYEGLEEVTPNFHYDRNIPEKERVNRTITLLQWLAE